MNWYSIFYWLSVADGVKNFFDITSNIATWTLCLSAIVWFILLLVLKTDPAIDKDAEYKGEMISSLLIAKRTTRVALWLSLILWAGWVFVPGKKDCLIIVAGGAVGTFITKDSSAKQIPGEVMTLLRDKLRSEIKEIHVADAIQDTLASKTKEELIEMYKNKK